MCQYLKPAGLKKATNYLNTAPPVKRLIPVSGLGVLCNKVKPFILHVILIKTLSSLKIKYTAIHKFTYHKKMASETTRTRGLDIYIYIYIKVPLQDNLKQGPN